MAHDKIKAADRPPLPEISAAVGAASKRSGGHVARPVIAAPDIQFCAAINHGMHTTASRHNGGSLHAELRR
jgi:hypothetical protein